MLSRHPLFPRSSRFDVHLEPLFHTSQWAYKKGGLQDEEGNYLIPPNANLIFDLQLVRVKSHEFVKRVKNRLDSPRSPRLTSPTSPKLSSVSSYSPRSTPASTPPQSPGLGPLSPPRSPAFAPTGGALSPNSPKSPLSPPWGPKPPPKMEAMPEPIM